MEYESNYSLPGAIIREGEGIEKQTQLLKDAGYKIGPERLYTLCIRDYWLRVARQPTPHILLTNGTRTAQVR